MPSISHTDLIINPDGSIYHLHLHPGDVADTILLVGDPARVRQVSAHFDHIDLIRQNREFETHTGTYKGKGLTVISTGIGCDNIDIVLNELDALFHIDLLSRQAKQEKVHLNLIRIGTCGTVQKDLAPGSYIRTDVAGGLDGLYHFYADPEQQQMAALSEAFCRHTSWKDELAKPYFIRGSKDLAAGFAGPSIQGGITLSTPGFYAPQQRSLRLACDQKGMLEKLSSFRYGDQRICNFEMESSALYALSALMEHRALTLCLAVANRINGKFLDQYPSRMDQLICQVLDQLSENEDEKHS